MTSVTGTLSEFIASAQQRSFPAEVSAKTAHHVLDTLAASVSGARLEAGKRAIKYVSRMGGAPQASVIGCRLRSSVIETAFANAMMAHADETDDSHAPSLTHPGCAIVPTALAAAEYFGANGSTVLRAVATGYDVGCRIALALGGLRLHQQHRSSHAVGSLFGAAAAAAVIAELDAERCAYLLSYAAQSAAGLTSWRRDRDHTEKAFVYSGLPARNAAATTCMVASGFTGVRDTLEGVPGLFAAYPTAAPERAIEALGSRYEIMHTTIKRWCVGSPIQAALDSTFTLWASAPHQSSDVERVEVELPSDSVHVVDGNEMPDVSLQHQVALMLADRTVTFASSHDPTRVSDPVVASLRARVNLVGSDGLMNSDPPRQAKVTIWLKDDTRLFHHTSAVRGTPHNSMSTGEVAAKALDLMEPMLGTRARQVVGRALDLGSVTRIEEVTNLLQAD